jgi:peroxiredoxin
VVNNAWVQQSWDDYTEHNIDLQSGYVGTFIQGFHAEAYGLELREEVRSRSWMLLVQQ